MPLTLRPLEEKDLAALEAFEREASPAAEVGAEPFARRLGRSGYRVLGAFDGERLVGVTSRAEVGGGTLLGRVQISGKPWPAVAPALLTAAVEPASQARWFAEVSAAHSPLMATHFFQKLGFWPGHALLHLSRTVPQGPAALPAGFQRGPRPPPAVDALVERLSPGLVLPERSAPAGGDEWLWREDAEGVAAVAVARQDAPSASLGVRFALVRPEPAAADAFDGLLEACAALGAALEARKVRVSVSAANAACHTRLLERGFQAVSLGFAFHRPADPPAHFRPELFALDDWR